MYVGYDKAILWFFQCWFIFPSIVVLRKYGIRSISNSLGNAIFTSYLYRFCDIFSSTSNKINSSNYFIRYLSNFSRTKFYHTSYHTSSIDFFIKPFEHKEVPSERRKNHAININEKVYTRLIYVRIEKMNSRFILMVPDKPKLFRDFLNLGGYSNMFINAPSFIPIESIELFDFGINNLKNMVRYTNLGKRLRLYLMKCS